MSYDPHTLPTGWQRRRSVQAVALPQEPRFDSVRLARLAIILALICFWMSVLMTVF